VGVAFKIEAVFEIEADDASVFEVEAVFGGEADASAIEVEAAFEIKADASAIKVGVAFEIEAVFEIEADDASVFEAEAVFGTEADASAIEVEAVFEAAFEIETFETEADASIFRRERSSCWINASAHPAARE
jgi:hypothetical protein